MAAPAYLLSLLQRQHLVLMHGFASRYPASWLVWEPGPWRAARNPVEAGVVKTHLALPTPGPQPMGADALCFELKNQPVTLLVGRDASSDVFINDLTLSRKHCLLHCDGAQWQLTVHEESSSVTTLGGEKLVPGKALPLTSGLRITAGAVELSFYDASGFLKRLQQENAKQP